MSLQKNYVDTHCCKNFTISQTHCFRKAHVVTLCILYLLSNKAVIKFDSLLLLSGGFIRISYILLYIQGDSRRKVNTLGDDSIGHCEKKFI
jgi:hypothetical protein